METIKRQSLDKAFAEKCAYSEIVEAGDFVFLAFCVGNVGKSIEEQVHGALDNMVARLEKVGLNLDSVVKVDVMMKDPWNIPIMEKVFKERFKGNYPARKTIATEFAHKGGVDGLLVQIDAIAYKNTGKQNK
jgi:enamine deaminase RidA (YjgF/YER057c/UK114 family)